MKILTIENKAAKVKLDDSVHEWSRKDLMAEIAKTYGSANFGNVEAYGEITNSAENAIDTLEIEINSPGGSVFDGFLIYNELLALRARGVHVTATINPLAASMGSVIAMAADTVRIVPNGQMMIHDAQVGARGNAKQLTKMAKVIDGISNEIAAIYAGKTGKTAEEMREMMVEETWLTAKESIELGLANELFDIGTPAAILTTSAATGNTDMSFINRLTNPASDEAIAEIAALKNQISETDASHAEIVAAMKAQLDTAEDALQEVATIKAEKDAAETALAEVTEAKAAADAEKVALEAKLVEAEASAAQKAVEIAAAAGIEAPLPIEGAAAVTSHIDAMAKLSPVDRAKYFRENKKAIMAEFRK